MSGAACPDMGSADMDSGLAGRDGSYIIVTHRTPDRSTGREDGVHKHAQGGHTIDVVPDLIICILYHDSANGSYFLINVGSIRFIWA